MLLGRVQHDEWTKFDEKGRPVCGVGYRGYWSNKIVFGGPSPFRQRKDGTWFNPKTGEDVRTMTLKELLEEYGYEPTE